MRYTFARTAMRGTKLVCEENGEHAPPAPGVPQRKLSRRRILAASSGLVLAAALGTAIVRSRGYAIAPDRKLLTLSPWQFVVVEHAARRIASSDRPGDASVPTADDLDVAGFVDAWLANMSDHIRRDLGRFLAYLEHLAPVAVGFASRFTRLGPDDQDAVLASIESSRHDLLRSGFEGLKSLVFAGYYRDPRAWSLLGYDGPLVGRPPAGWR